MFSLTKWLPNSVAQWLRAFTTNLYKSWVRIPIGLLLFFYLTKNVLKHILAIKFENSKPARVFWFQCSKFMLTINQSYLIQRVCPFHWLLKKDWRRTEKVLSHSLISWFFNNNITKAFEVDKRKALFPIFLVPLIFNFLVCLFNFT